MVRNIKAVQFMSQSQAESLTAEADTALISITEPGDPQAAVDPEWKHLLRLSFHDVDQDRGEGFRLFDEMHARQILDFVESLPEEINYVIVHCHAGISRSAAVAKVIASATGASFNEKYSLYNKHVYSVLNRCLTERLILEADTSLSLS